MRLRAHAGRGLAEPSVAGAPEPGLVRLEVKGLEVGLGKHGPDVVSDVSFSVRAGEVFGLVGESGSGKTTVALALLAYARRGLAIRSGSVLLDGLDVLSLSRSDLRSLRGARVAYVPQDPGAALNPALRVGKQLVEPLAVHGEAHRETVDRVAEVMADVRLDVTADILRRYPHQLSGGQQQRVALAMAFVCRPSLIVLDEPTTGLDVSTQRHVLDTIRLLCRSYGVAAVYVSHDLAVVGDLVAKVAVMYAGRIIELGATEGVFGQPVHPYTRGLLAAVPAPDRPEVLVGVEGQPPRPGNRPQGCGFAPRCGFAVDACRTAPPPPIALGERLVRCIRANNIDAGTRRVPVQVARLEGAADPVLTVRGLSAKYGDVPVLADIDLEAAAQRCERLSASRDQGRRLSLAASWACTVTGQVRSATTARLSLRRPASDLARCCSRSSTSFRTPTRR